MPLQATEEGYKTKGAYIILESPNFDNQKFLTFEIVTPRSKVWNITHLQKICQNFGIIADYTCGLLLFCFDVLSLSCQGFWNYCVLGNFQTVKVLNAGPDSQTRHEDEIKKDCISMCSAGSYSTLRNNMFILYTLRHSISGLLGLIKLHIVIIFLLSINVLIKFIILRFWNYRGLGNMQFFKVYLHGYGIFYKNKNKKLNFN